MSTENVKAGSHEIEMQRLHHTVVITVDGKEIDISVSEALELHEKLGNIINKIPQWAIESTVWDHPTH